MHVVFVGGGAHRYLGVARSILNDQAFEHPSSIRICDLDAHRAQVMATMIQKTPEFAKANCTVQWDTDLAKLLPGADVVCVVIMAGGPVPFQRDMTICRAHGFVGSDQLSASGAMLALRGGPILMNIAKQMQEHCPDAWLLDFANPVAVLSAAVNNHTDIRCLGVCAGYTNHQWDITRLLGEDAASNDYTIDSAGVNHLSFILESSKVGNEPLYDVLKRKIDDNWSMPALSSRWNESARNNITRNVTRLKNIYQRFGHLVFSSEPDGLAHVELAEHFHPIMQKPELSQLTVDHASLEKNKTLRRQADNKFEADSQTELTQTDWDTPNPERLYRLRDDDNVMSLIITAIGSDHPKRIATSYLNHGAVDGFTDRTVLEYTQHISRHGIKPAGQYQIPPVFQGLISGLATHQTLLGDAIATRDPKVLFEACFNYPIFTDMPQSRWLWKSLIEHNAQAIGEELAEAANYFAD
ncbi:MAG: hypothetical protein CMJ19_06075 [Phycisphaeraceae bacterium]|mgnify:CR=1 FL=1|nr:hypothetical protein [Phycisphaeraceae bacterium]